MPFEPSTKLYIGTVPFDNSYRHVREFSTRAAQQEYFASVCPTGIRREDYTYQRTQNTVKVPYNAEQIYGYNYCMFQNANYGDRWFYSFIVDVEYINEETCKLYLELDLMQTWFLDCEIKACMVEREHVSNDTIGAHIKDEGIDPGELKCTYATVDNNQMELYIVVASAVEPLTDGTYVNNGGDRYEGIISGTSLSVFLSIESFQDFMQALSSNGQQDAVSAVYMVPRAAIDNIVRKDNGYGYWVQSSESSAVTDQNYNLGFNTLDGYTPKNNKTYCYPFEYAELTNFSGDNQQLRLEFFSTPGTVSVQRVGGSDANSRLMYIPTNYNGVNRFVEGSIELAAYPSCNWVYQAFANMYGASNVDLFGLQFNSLTQLPFVNNYVDTAQGLIGSALSLDIGGLLNGAVDNVQDQVNAYAAISKTMKTPNTSRGGTNSTTALVNASTYTLGIRKYTARYEMAKQIDDYFSTFGYLVAETKVPNIRGRQSWNYVKTNAANVRGKVPASTLKFINNLFDRGVTFWHTNDVGNYDLGNGII